MHVLTLDDLRKNKDKYFRKCFGKGIDSMPKGDIIPPMQDITQHKQQKWRKNMSNEMDQPTAVKYLILWRMAIDRSEIDASGWGMWKDYSLVREMEALKIEDISPGNILIHGGRVHFVNDDETVSVYELFKAY